MNKYVLVAMLLFLVGCTGFATVSPDTIPKKCMDKTFSYERLDCLQPYFAALTKTFSAEVAITKATELQEQQIIDDCHLVAHFIGEANLEKYDLDVGRAFSTCKLGCIEGCFHGVMEAYIGYHGDERILSEIASVCDSIASDTLLHRQCIHGVGHGLFALGLPINNAITQCQKFTQSFGEETFAEVCLGGVFMENMDQYLLLDEQSLREKLPTVCNEISELQDEDLMFMCKYAIGDGVMFYTGHNLTKSWKMCEELSSGDAKICKYAALLESEGHLEDLG